MRKIEFRGKDDESGKFVYGYYQLDRDMRRRAPFLLKPSISWKEDEVLYSSFVIPETVGQYTGMKDINGKKIFEGDILKNEPGTIYGGSYNFEVEYINGMFQGISNCVELEPLYFSECEIIGNVFDNPEAIKGA